MAMNKTEKAAFEDLRIKSALRTVIYDVQPLSLAEIEKETGYAGTRKLFVGYWTNAHITGPRVGEGCTNGVNHSSHSVDKTSTQTIDGPWYYTRLDALKALRMRVQDKCAAILAKIDDDIDAEESIPQ